MKNISVVWNKQLYVRFLNQQVFGPLYILHVSYEIKVLFRKEKYYIEWTIRVPMVNTKNTSSIKHQKTFTKLLYGVILNGKNITKLIYKLTTLNVTLNLNVMLGQSVAHHCHSSLSMTCFYEFLSFQKHPITYNYLLMRRINLKNVLAIYI